MKFLEGRTGSESEIKYLQNSQMSDEQMFRQLSYLYKNHSSNNTAGGVGGLFIYGRQHLE